MRVFTRPLDSAIMQGSPEIDIAKLKKALIENTGIGGKFSRRSLSLAATGNKNPDLVRDILGRGQDRRVSLQTAAGIAAALGIDVRFFVTGSATGKEQVRIRVKGDVQAGVWREQAEWQEEEQFEVEALPIDFSAERFGLRVVGYSMDKLFLPGTILDCFRVGFGTTGPEPRDGDIVIVQRRQGDLYETTCKQLAIVDGEYLLRPLSTKPEFQQELRLGKPDSDDHTDNGCEIVGIVNSAITQIYRK